MFIVNTGLVTWHHMAGDTCGLWRQADTACMQHSLQFAADPITAQTNLYGIRLDILHLHPADASSPVNLFNTCLDKFSLKTENIQKCSVDAI